MKVAIAREALARTRLAPIEIGPWKEQNQTTSRSKFTSILQSSLLHSRRQAADEQLPKPLALEQQRPEQTAQPRPKLQPRVKAFSLHDRQKSVSSRYHPSSEPQWRMQQVFLKNRKRQIEQVREDHEIRLAIEHSIALRGRYRKEAQARSQRRRALSSARRVQSEPQQLRREQGLLRVRKLVEQNLNLLQIKPPTQDELRLLNPKRLICGSLSASRMYEGQRAKPRGSIDRLEQLQLLERVRGLGVKARALVVGLLDPRDGQQ